MKCFPVGISARNINRRGLGLVVSVVVLALCADLMETRVPAQESAGGWTITRIISKKGGEYSSEREVIVRDCGVVSEEKECNCSAEDGTTTGISITLEGGSSVGLGLVNLSANISLGAEFQISSVQSSGESLKLPAAPGGKAVIYKIEQKFRRFTGKAVTKAPNGDERVVDYVIQSTCSLKAVSSETVGCDEMARRKSAAPKSETSNILFQDKLLGTWAVSTFGIKETSFILKDRLVDSSEKAGFSALNHFQSNPQTAQFTGPEKRVEGGTLCQPGMYWVRTIDENHGKLLLVRRQGLAKVQLDLIYDLEFVDENTLSASLDSMWNVLTSKWTDFPKEKPQDGAFTLIRLK